MLLSLLERYNADDMSMRGGEGGMILFSPVLLLLLLLCPVYFQTSFLSETISMCAGTAREFVLCKQFSI